MRVINVLALILIFLMGVKSQFAQSHEGHVAKSYFQQEVNYVIEVELDDENHFLHAFEHIEYINHSHHKIEFIYMHLWPNGYKNGRTALSKQILERGSYWIADIENKEYRGYIDSLSFTVDDKVVKWEYDSVHEDICKIYLNEALNPNEKIKISTPFRVKIPGDISRLGHVKQSYQISQWYPKPAVFDRDGWHPMPYLDQGEFYSEYGSFDVRITLPKNYVVGATGDLQNEDERSWLLARAEETKRIAEFPKKDSFPKSDVETKKLRYIQKNVHDFAWFADKRYHVLKSAVKLPDSEDSVETWVMFNNTEADLWKESIPYLNDAIYYYSLWNGNYPYKQATVVHGALSAGGGMEYPNVTVIGHAGTAKALDLVITHEVGHNWFYGILGFNEREFPSLDEGINSFNELRYMELKYPGLAGLVDSVPAFAEKWFNLQGLDHRKEFYLFYSYFARRNEDQPILYPAAEYTEMNYGGIVYAKMAISMQMMRAYLGDEVFDKAMQEFYNEWKFKHPGPADLREVLEKVSGRKLAWFFNDYLNTTKKMDLKMKGLKNHKDGVSVTLKNKTDLSTPVFISSVNGDRKIINTYKFDPLATKRTYELPKEGATHYKIDGNKELVEINRRNNWIRANGLMKKSRPLQMRLLTSLENDDKSQLFWTPLVAWNSSDELMSGLAFHNKSVFEKPFEFVLAPMYSFRRNDAVGLADISYHWYFSKGIKRITANFNFMRFSYNSFFTVGGTTTWNRYYPNIKFDFKPKREKSKHRQNLKIGTILTEELMQKEGTKSVNNTNTYPQLEYNHEFESVYREFENQLAFEGHDEFAKMSLTSIFRQKYRKGKNAFSARFFFGSFLANSSTSPRYNWRMDGQSGYHDYTFGTTMPDREQDLDVWSNQLIDNHGGFKTPTALAQSNEWIGALNLKAELPLAFPLGFFADFGTADNGDFVFDGGAYLPIWRDKLEIYFPFLWSDNIMKADEAIGRSYAEKIRFVLNLQAINPYKVIQPKKL